MRKFVTVAVLLLCAAGCSLNQEFVGAVDQSWGVIGPRYEAYIDADPALSEEVKALRKLTAQSLTELIEEAKQ